MVEFVIFHCCLADPVPERQSRGLFLKAPGRPLPEHSQTKSARALSRFFNQYRWLTRDTIRTVRHCVLRQVLSLYIRWIEFCYKNSATLLGLRIC